jgi:hypothetical protein
MCAKTYGFAQQKKLRVSHQSDFDFFFDEFLSRFLALKKLRSALSKKPWLSLLLPVPSDDEL